MRILRLGEILKLNWCHWGCISGRTARYVIVSKWQIFANSLCCNIFWDAAAIHCSFVPNGKMVYLFLLKSRFAPYPTKSFNTSESNNSQSVFKKTLVPQQPQDKAFLLSNVWHMCHTTVPLLEIQRILRNPLEKKLIYLSRTTNLVSWSTFDISCYGF